MDDMSGVEIFGGITELIDDWGSLSFSEAFTLAQLFEERAIAGILHHHVDSCFVVEVAVHSDDVRMHESGVNFYLISELRMHILSLDVIFLNSLDCHLTPCALLSCEVHNTELPFIELLDQHEVIKTPAYLGLPLHTSAPLQLTQRCFEGWAGCFEWRARRLERWRPIVPFLTNSECRSAADACVAIGMARGLRKGTMWSWNRRRVGYRGLEYLTPLFFQILFEII